MPAVRKLEELTFHPKVTFLIGENGSGKSTLVESLAICCGFNPEGGTKNFRFETRRAHSVLHKYLRVARNARRERDGFFLRAESFFNAASYIEASDAAADAAAARSAPIIASYGGRSLHEQSHGESFLTLAEHRFGGRGLYILDEPEAALSPSRQLAFLKIVDRLVQSETSQFVIATHSPILMAYPDAVIYHLGPAGLAPVRYEDTEHYQVTRTFLADPERYFKHLFRDES